MICEIFGHNWITSLMGYYNSYCKRCGHIATKEEGGRTEK